MIESTDKIHNESWSILVLGIFVLKSKHLGSLNEDSILILNTKLSISIVALCPDSAFSSEHTSKEISTDNFDNRDIEIKSIRNRGDIFKFYELLSSNFIVLNLFLAFLKHICHTTCDKELWAITFIDAMEQGIDISWNHIVQQIIEIRMLDWWHHPTLRVFVLVLLYNLISQSYFRTLIVPPHI